jgi:hypothetical protein
MSKLVSKKLMILKIIPKEISKQIRYCSPKFIDVSIYLNLAKGCRKLMVLGVMMKTMDFALNRSKSCHADRSCLPRSWWSLSGHDPEQADIQSRLFGWAFSFSCHEVC